MDRQKLVNYIKEQLSKRVGKEIIINTLIAAGWQSNDIEQAFNIINNLSIASSQSEIFTGIITEQNYPIEVKWISKSILGLLLVVLTFSLFILFGINDGEMKLYMIIYIGLVPLTLIYAALRRITFHYSIDDKFLLFKQGILSKQQRHIPYGVIQNIYVKQDLLDRLFGLSSLVLENASEGGKNKVERQQTETIGFSGNKVSIPGLAKQNAEILKNIILKKIKENPIEDSQSGL